MGVSGSHSSRVRGSDSQSSAGTDIAEINEINITPFVDVVLVLLVIFIVTAPMMMKDIIKLQLPKSSVTDGSTDSPLAIAVTKQGQYIVNGNVLTDEALIARARETANSKPNTSVIIAGDIDASHGSVMRVIEIVKSQGLQNFAIQIERSRKSEQ